MLTDKEKEHWEAWIKAEYVTLGWGWKMEERMNSYDKVSEAVAEIEHKQWEAWASNLLPELHELTIKHRFYCKCETCERITRWENLLNKRYDQLDEDMKVEDREWADKFLSITVDNLAVAIVKVDGELPLIRPSIVSLDPRINNLGTEQSLWQDTGQRVMLQDMLKAGYTHKVIHVAQEREE